MIIRTACPQLEIVAAMCAKCVLIIVGRPGCGRRKRGLLRVYLSPGQRPVEPMPDVPRTVVPSNSLATNWKSTVGSRIS